MITLSARLKNIADKIKKGETMADIGTDHGFLPLYLYEKGISPVVIMTDVSRFSLEKSIENARQTGRVLKEEGIYARWGDGLEVLDAGEVDTVVMAGIGGNLMEEILEKDPEKSKSFKRYILQPRRHPGHIRHYLINNGYAITDESIVREGKFLCEIITACPEKFAGSLTADEKMMNSPGTSIYWEVPSWYAHLEDDLAAEYVERKLNREKMILESKKESEKADTEETKCNIMYLENLLQKMQGFVI